MNSDWLAAASFERTQEVVSAINALSIHAKLRRAGAREPFETGEIEQARDRLLQFLDACERLVESSADDRSTAIVGADPRLSHLALRLFNGAPPHDRARPGGRPLRLVGCGIPFDEVRDLLRSGRDEDLEALLPCLRSLRALVEEHAQGDLVTILGDE
jgi:hypothetical protein